jgi:phosphoribosylformylglycinamidine synthase
MREIAAAGLAESAHDVSDGGLAVALAESSFGPAGVGAAVELDSGLREEFLLFHEGPSRILVSTGQPEAVEALARRHGVEARRIGTTVAGRIRIARGGRVLIECAVEPLRRLWDGALERMLRT